MTDKNYALTIKLDGLPPRIMKKVERLDFIIGILSRVGSSDIKIYPEERINEIKRYVTEAQNLHQSLLNEDNIINLVGQNPAWVAIDKLTVQEVNDKLQMMKDLWDGGAEISVHREVEDVSKPLPTDDFSDEEEEEAFW